jgi:ribosome biogenesis GTPase A
LYWNFFSQILDARNPLLFRSPDLEKYVKEVSALKANLILLNKVFIIQLLTFTRIVATVWIYAKLIDAA